MLNLGQFQTVGARGSTLCSESRAEGTRRGRTFRGAVVTEREFRYYAHSENRVGRKHPLKLHVAGVSKFVQEFLAGTSFVEEGVLAGVLHDVGKYGDLFQARLRGEEQGLDHWSQGAWIALFKHRAIAAALAIQGHHVGLQQLICSALHSLEPRKLAANHPLQLRLSEQDIRILEERLSGDGIRSVTPNVTLLGTNPESRLDRMLDVRMLFSALVDADFLDTEAHFQGDQNGKCYRKPGPELHADIALKHLLGHLDELRAKTLASGAVSQVRQQLLDFCMRGAETKPGLFTLTAPTGSGKTLAMLAFALRHALTHNLRRLVLVIPYLSIIEQTAGIYRDLFAPVFGEHYVLEHHSLAGVGEERGKTDNEGSKGKGNDTERQRRLLAENWDAPLVVTTSVQFLESLFSNRPSACRKLHRLARSVILFDEVQTLPTGLAVPTLGALSHLAHAHGSSVVFSTATQPAFEHLHEAIAEHCAMGWRPRPIVPEPAQLFTPMKRVDIQWEDSRSPLSWAEIARRILQETHVLCVVNLKRHAGELWEQVGAGALHLSTHMCPAHRRNTLNQVRECLNPDHPLPVRLIATQCIEAGVDVDFPSVYRAYGPLEAIIQAAGRCNREGKRPQNGIVTVFMPQDEGYPPGGYEQATRITTMLLRDKGPDGMRIDDAKFITAYYRTLYDISGAHAATRAEELLRYVQAGSFPDVARAYRLIAQDAINVLVPYREAITEFQRLREIADRRGLTAQWIKDARDLCVSMYRPKPDDTIWDALIPVKVAGREERTSDDWFVYAIEEHYHPQLGLVPSGSLNNWIA